MIEILEFMFRSFWHFSGMVILLVFAGKVLVGFLYFLMKGFTPYAEINHEGEVRYNGELIHNGPIKITARKGIINIDTKESED